MASTEAQIKSEIERLTGICICQHSTSIHRFELLFFSWTATINQHKMYNRNTNYNQGKYSTDYTANKGRRSNVYVNPNYKPANKYTRPTAASKTDIATDSFGVVDQLSTSSTSYAGVSSVPAPAPGTAIPTSVDAQKREIVLGGVAFESSSRSLVRKDRELSFMYPRLLINPSFPSYLVPRVNKPISVGSSASSIRHHPYGHKKPGHIRPTRGYKMKARRGRNMTLNNGRRPYPYVFRLSFFIN